MTPGQFAALLGFLFTAAWIGFGLGEAILCLIGAGVLDYFTGRYQRAEDRWEAAKAIWPEVEESSRNPEFWWIPPLDTCVFKVFVETDEEPTGTPPAALHPPARPPTRLTPLGVAADVEPAGD